MSEKSTWPMDEIELQHDEVHVWLVSLKMGGEESARLLEALSSDERERAHDIKAPVARERFIGTRGWLREILARYIQVKPSEIELTYGKYGKPRLGPASQPSDLQFNVSHSGDLAAVAVAKRRELGVDIERIRPGVAVRQLAQRYFAAGEAARLKKLQAAEMEAFFTCWSRKEAYTKATGEGLRLPFEEFEVSVAPWEQAAILSTQWDKDEAHRWTLEDLNPAPGYVGTVAVEGEGWQLSRRWAGECSEWA